MDIQRPYTTLDMLPGYNTDVQHGGSSYHIQTEDNGDANPTVITLIYMGGAILARRKTDYRHLMGRTDRQEEVRRLMYEQHRLMIGMIMEGKLEAHLRGEADIEGGDAQPLGLDEAIMRFLSESSD